MEERKATVPAKADSSAALRNAPQICRGLSLISRGLTASSTSHAYVLKEAENSVQAARKPNFVLGDHSSRPAIADRLQQPTRRFRLCPKATCFPPARDGPSRTGRQEEAARIPCLFGLAPCGVYRAVVIAADAVGSYPTLSPLPPALRPEAVCFLLHWPSSGLDARIPDVIRHTALRSSDFPPLRNARRRAQQRSLDRLHIFQSIWSGLCVRGQSCKTFFAGMTSE
jgi:hypothetical protein